MVDPEETSLETVEETMPTFKIFFGLGLVAVLAACQPEDSPSATYVHTFGPEITTVGELSSTSDSEGGVHTVTGYTHTGDVDEAGHTSEMDSDLSAPSDPPVCGNGVIEEGEACDDANFDSEDGCQECETDKIIFVSSELYRAYKLGGLTGADFECQALAAISHLLQPELWPSDFNAQLFKAWLSTPEEPVNSRLRHSRGRYILINGLVLAQNWDELISGKLQYPLEVDEYSQTHHTGVWTGTFSDGRPTTDFDFCGDWEKSGSQAAASGLSSVVDGTWSFLHYTACNAELSIYCVQQ